MFVTFIYKVRGNPTTCYGKYLSNDLSDDRHGLDVIVRSVLVNGLNKQCQRDGLDRVIREEFVTVGILSVDVGDVYYSTDEEIQAFDFYYTDYGYCSDCAQTFFNGELIR